MGMGWEQSPVPLLQGGVSLSDHQDQAWALPGTLHLTQPLQDLLGWGWGGLSIVGPGSTSQRASPLSSSLWL